MLLGSSRKSVPSDKTGIFIITTFITIDCHLVGNVGNMSATCRQHDWMLWVQTLVAMSFFDVSFYFYERIWYVTSACRRRHWKCPVLSVKKTVSGHRTFLTKDCHRHPTFFFFFDTTIIFFLFYHRHFLLSR